MSHGAGGRRSEDLCMVDGSSYIGCPLKMGDELFTACERGEEDKVGADDEIEFGLG